MNIELKSTIKGSPYLMVVRVNLWSFYYRFTI